MYIKLNRLMAAAILFATAWTGNAPAQGEPPSYQVIRHASHSSWNVNSWLLVSEQGLVLVDAQMLRGDARRLAAVIKTFGLPLEAVIITHPHPDHFLGLAELREQLGQFEVIAAQNTAAQMEGARDQFVSWAGSVYGDEIIDVVVPATRIINHNQTLSLAGLELQIELLGAAESADHLVIYEPSQKALFSGDLYTPACHLYVGEGRSAALLNVLKHLAGRYAQARLVFPGHGDPGRIGQVSHQIRYLQELRHQFLQLSEEHRNAGEQGLSQTGRDQLIARMQNKYGHLCDYNLPVEQLFAMNIAGLEQELLAPEVADGSAPASGN